MGEAGESDLSSLCDHSKLIPQVKSLKSTHSTPGGEAKQSIEALAIAVRDLIIALADAAGQRVSVGDIPVIEGQESGAILAHAVVSAAFERVIDCDARVRLSLEKLRQHEQREHEVQSLQRGVLAMRQTLRACVGKLKQIESQLTETMEESRDKVKRVRISQSTPLNPDRVVEYASVISDTTSGPPLNRAPDIQSQRAAFHRLPYPQEAHMRSCHLFTPVHLPPALAQRFGAKGELLEQLGNGMAPPASTAAPPHPHPHPHPQKGPEATAPLAPESMEDSDEEIDWE